TRFGGGVEVFPLRRSEDLRAHACLSYGWGEQGNPDGVGHDRELLATVGVTMRLDLLNVKKKTKE
ncbi:MAG: hypothetical protein HUK02_00860, partial [Bacteroidaceae bacterium]|nr:hypothetical protein [Bacteroidaceae bacterium]